MPTIFYDVTEISRLNRKTGIQRVTWEIFRALETLTLGSYWALVPVIGNASLKHFSRASIDESAESFLANTNELAIHPSDADVFLSVDLHYKIEPGLVYVLSEYRKSGCSLFFLVYDILPIIHPGLFAVDDQWFGNEDFLSQFTYWLSSAAALSNTLICISMSTQASVGTWLENQSIPEIRRPRLAHFRLGTSQLKSIEKTATHELDGIFNTSKTFLMVGTLEPRKGHTLALDAFDLLWNEGGIPKLVIIGKRGWKSETLTLRIKNHRLLGRSLFYLGSATDEELAYAYSSASALLSISEAEGFGLPNIEAASYGLPILARDIEIFREVCGDGAYYLPNDLKPKSLAQHLKIWIELDEAGIAPSSSKIKLVSWQNSALELLSSINIKI
jgi:glycosyltransferase involved in cell wall biosynthesis